MKKCKYLIFFFVLLAVMLSACSAADTGAESERKEVDFTVMDPRRLPEELAGLIEENKQNEIRMTYTDGTALYLIRGYGEQKTGGYSIEGAGCTEDAETVYFDTRLLGPSGQEKLPKEPSYPYLVVKVELRDKEVLIQ